MADTISGSLEGYDELLKILQHLGDEKKVNNLLKKTNRIAVKPLQKVLKSMNFPKRLTKTVGIRAASIEGNRHPNAVVVGPTTDSFVLRFLNTGTKERYTKSGAYRGKIIGKNIIESIIDDNAVSLLKSIPKQYGEDLIKLTKKDVKKINKNS